MKQIYRPPVSLLGGPSDIIIKRRAPTVKGVPDRTGKRRKRGSINRLSKASKKRLLLAARNFQPGLFIIMVTLTYPGDWPTDGEKVKRDLQAFKRVLKRRGIGGFWVLEFQIRGAPHFHIFCTQKISKEFVSRSWYRIVGSGDEKHLKAGIQVAIIRKPHAVAAYAAKYAAKLAQKDVPMGYENVGRFWGFFGVAPSFELFFYNGTNRPVYQTVRAVRKLAIIERKSWRNARRLRDRGSRGFTAWGIGSMELDRIWGFYWDDWMHRN